jgi:hypothetical protein
MSFSSEPKIELQNDLKFSSENAEVMFREFHMATQRNMDIQFHFARAAAWLAIAVRMFIHSTLYKHYVSSIIIFLGVITTLIPAVAHKLIPPDRYVRYRPFVIFVDNVLQVALGCYTHEDIYPVSASSWSTASPFKALAVTVTGNGNAWLNMSGLLGCLPFRFAVIQQAILVVIMLLTSRPICQRSFELQKGHISVHRALARALHRLVPSPILSPLKSLLASPSRGLASAMSDAAWAETLCVVYQSISLLLLGFIVPTFILYRSETMSRLKFLKAHGVQHPATVPTAIEYLGFAIPATACIYLYIITLI